MPMTRKERIKLIIVIGLAIIFIGVGYFRFFSGKTAVPAADPRSAAAPVQGVSPVVDAKSLFPERGAVEGRAAPLAAIRDIFAPWSEPVVETPRPVESVKVEESNRMSTPPSPPLPPPPLPSLMLTGTIIGGRIPLAFINGRSFRLGDKVEGYLITSITREQVTLMGEGQKVELNVLKPLDGDHE